MKALRFLPILLVFAGATLAAPKHDAEKQLQFNIDTTVNDYLKVGKRNPKWDKAATNLLHAFAKSRSGIHDAEIHKVSFEASKQAIDLGCDDPFVKYLYLRAHRGAAGEADEKLAQEYKQTAEAFGNSQYHPIRKFYASLRASEALMRVDVTNHWKEIQPLWHFAGLTLSNVISNPALPSREADEAVCELLRVTERSKKHFEWMWTTLEKPLFQNWGNMGFPYAIKGWFYNEYAWDARGSTYADKVPEDQWPVFRERLKTAEAALEKGWTIDQTDFRIPYHMLMTEVGQGNGRKVMELWFARAMAIQTNSWDACNRKLYYLEPKWHGSREEMLKFGRECVQRDDWGGSVPLILPHAHDVLVKYLKDPKEKEKYWESPEVWADVHSAFTRFFARNPDADGYHHDYARYAYKCKQWDVLNEEIPKLGEINYAFFGGKEKFEEMKRLAAEHNKK